MNGGFKTIPVNLKNFLTMTLETNKPIEVLIEEQPLKKLKK